MISALLTLSLVVVSQTNARPEPYERITQCFQSLQAAAPTSLPPTEEDARRLLTLSTRCGWAIVLEKLTPEERAAVSGLEIRLEDGDGPPARIQGNTIRVSFDALARAAQVGQVIGHDVFVDAGNLFPVPSIVAYAPLATRPIVGLTSRLSGWIDGAAAATACRVPDCMTIQGVAMFLGIEGFLLAHEAAHVILRHASAEGAEIELAADRWAYGLLRRYDGELDSSHTLRLARTAGRLAPIVYFDYLRSRLLTSEELLRESSPHVQMVMRRRAQLAQLADKDDTLTLDTFAPLVSGGVGRLIVAVADPGDSSARFWIDGVPLSAWDVVGRERIVAAGVRHVAAWANGRFAYATEVLTAGQRQTVRLQFSPPLPSVDPLELETLAKRRDQAAEEKWLQVFLRTTTASGAPRAATVALRHYQAMSMMRLGALIPETPPGIDDPRTLQTIRRWREQAQPLSRWR
jgi:hypothetical protein